MRTLTLSLAIVLASTMMHQRSRADEPENSGPRAPETTVRDGVTFSDYAEDAAEVPAERTSPTPPRKLPRDPGYATVEHGNEAKAKAKAEDSANPFIEEEKEPERNLSPPPENLYQEELGYQEGPAPYYRQGYRSPPSYSRRDPCCWGGRVVPPTRILDRQELYRRGIEIGGWLDQGFTGNANNPRTERFNGPVAFNDFPNEYQMNQLWVFLDRPADTGGYGWDIGGRVDFNYGTDSRFIVANGLETNWNGATGFYDMAMPQLYADVAYNDLTVRMGHFFTILGYERVEAPRNFFYSHSLTKVYGQALTYTGLLAMYDLTDRFSVSGGFQRGWNQWTGSNDSNGDLGFLGGMAYDNVEMGTTLRFAINSGDNNPGSHGNRTVYSLVFEQQLPARFRYVLQHNFGHEDNAIAAGNDAYWYSNVNYLFFMINEQWTVGFRYEMFNDEEGVRVRGIGPPKGYSYPQPPQGPIPTLWQDITLGVKYMHNPNVTVRSEIRWDWAESYGLQRVGDGPFNDYTERRQFLWTVDLIVQF